MFRALVLVARIIYWISSFVILGAFIALVLHFSPAVFSEGNGKHGFVDPSGELVVTLWVIGIGMWLLAQALAFVAARWLERLVEQEDEI